MWTKNINVRVIWRPWFGFWWFIESHFQIFILSIHASFTHEWKFRGRNLCGLKYKDVVSTGIFTRDQFWPTGIVIACVCGSVCVYQSRACPLDNSSPSQARITKFGPEMQNTLVWVPIVFGDDRPWSSRSNLTWKSNFTSFWACSHHYSSAIQARISKFGPKMHLSTVKIPTNFGLDWFWSLLSFSILKPIFSTKFICALFVYI